MSRKRSIECDYAPPSKNKKAREDKDEWTRKVNSILHVSAKPDSVVKESYAQYDKQFERIAMFLMNECAMQINHSKYRFLELEFYLNCQKHVDPYCHSRSEQGSVNQWYFHRAGNKPESKFKAGTRKGLDLTFGCSGCVSHGGILIRSIQLLDRDGNDTDTKICGPCLIVDSILSDAAATNLDMLVKTMWNNNTCATDASNCDRKLTLIPRKSKTTSTTNILSTTRVGLSLSEEELGKSCLYLMGRLNNEEAKLAASKAFYLCRDYRFLDQAWILNHLKGKMNKSSSVLPQTGISLNLYQHDTTLNGCNWDQDDKIGQDTAIHVLSINSNDEISIATCTKQILSKIAPRITKLKTKFSTQRDFYYRIISFLRSLLKHWIEDG